ncbi:nitroreductase/quinone reductase family protein [Nonomuraea sp. K271]
MRRKACKATNTGARRTTPLGHLPGGDRVLLIASAGGSARHPA